MESRSQSDGGGGHYGCSLLLTGTSHGRPHATQAFNTAQDPALAEGHQPTTPALLSLQQTQINRSSNNYIEGPTGAQKSPASQHRQEKPECRVVLPAPRTSKDQETVQERPNNLQNLVSLTLPRSSNLSISSRGEELGTMSVVNIQTKVMTSIGSNSSRHRPLSFPTAGEQIIRTQPQCEELKPLNIESGAAVALPSSRGSQSTVRHHVQCEDCGRCRCPECSRPRLLPSCWLCSRRCLCSARTAVDCGTCVCCIKGIFYHCSSDNEDACIDAPFSCTQAHCCARWTTVSFLSILFPCILCYLPAKGCVAALQSCHDCATRPGCRCKNTNAVHFAAAGNRV